LRSGLSADLVLAGLSTLGAPTGADCGEAADNSDIAWFGLAADLAAASETVLAPCAARIHPIAPRQRTPMGRSLERGNGTRYLAFQVTGAIEQHDRAKTGESGAWLARGALVRARKGATT
jgi:hypothetical protein